MKRLLWIIPVIIIVIVFYFYGGKLINRTKMIVLNNPVKLPNGKDSNFEWWELVQTSKPYPNLPNSQEQNNLVMLVDKILQPIRDTFGPTILSNVFRSALVNKAVGGSPNSQHKLGLAGDITKTGNTPLYTAFERIRKSNIPYDQLIYETGTKDNPSAVWIHISYNPNGGRKQAMLSPYNYATDERDYINVT